MPAVHVPRCSNSRPIPLAIPRTYIHSTRGSRRGGSLMKKQLIAVTATLVVGAATALPGMAASGPEIATTRATNPAYALVQLTGAPLSTAATTRPQGGKKINFRSAAVRNYRADLAAKRNQFRSWLRANAPSTRITGEFDLAVNAVSVKLNGASLRMLRSAPGVRFVEQQGVFTPVAHEDPDLSLSHVNEAWTAVGGESNAGAGVDVAIIDSGIDVSHPCFDDAGYPAVPQSGDPDLTNNKVVVAKAYGNKLAKQGFDASDQNGHGTHVAGTVACN